MADILSEKNLSIGASTGVFNKRKPGKENHELLLCRWRSVVLSIKRERDKKHSWHGLPDFIFTTTDTGCQLIFKTGVTKTGVTIDYVFRVNSGYRPESPALTMVWERVFVTIIYESVSQKKHWQVGTLRRNNFADVCITWKCCTQRIKSAVLRLNVQCGRYTNEFSFKVSAHKS